MQTALVFRHEPQPTVRRLERIPVRIGGTLQDAKRRPVDVTVHDISRLGFMAETDACLAVDATVEIRLPGIGRRTARIVWANGRLHGCAFVDEPGDPRLGQAITEEAVPLVEFNGRQGSYAGRYSPEPLYRRKPWLAGVATILAAAMPSALAAAVSLSCF